MLKRIFLLNLIMLCGISLTFAQDETKVSFDDSALPLKANSEKNFAPKGWVVEETVSGDLNADSMPDTVLVLIEKPKVGIDKDNPESRERVLLILFKNAKGELERVAVAKNLLPCTGCGGVLNATAAAPDIKITNGILIFKSLIGSRESSDMTFRFRYDPNTKKFPLIGYDDTENDSATGASTKTSTNFLTGVQVTDEFQFSQKLNKDVKQSTNQTRIKKPLQNIEDVNYETMMEGNQ